MLLGMTADHWQRLRSRRNILGARQLMTVRRRTHRPVAQYPAGQLANTGSPPWIEFE